MNNDYSYGAPGGFGRKTYGEFRDARYNDLDFGRDLHIDMMMRKYISDVALKRPDIYLLLKKEQLKALVGFREAAYESKDNESVEYAKTKINELKYDIKKLEISLRNEEIARKTKSA